MARRRAAGGRARGAAVVLSEKEEAAASASRPRPPRSPSSCPTVEVSDDTVFSSNLQRLQVQGPVQARPEHRRGPQPRAPASVVASLPGASAGRLRGRGGGRRRLRGRPVRRQRRRLGGGSSGSTGGGAGGGGGGGELARARDQERLLHLRRRRDLRARGLRAHATAACSASRCCPAPSRRCWSSSAPRRAAATRSSSSTPTCSQAGEGSCADRACSVLSLGPGLRAPLQGRERPRVRAGDRPHPPVKVGQPPRRAPRAPRRGRPRAAASRATSAAAALVSSLLVDTETVTTAAASSAAGEGPIGGRDATPDPRPRPARRGLRACCSRPPAPPPPSARSPRTRRSRRSRRCASRPGRTLTIRGRNFSRNRRRNTVIFAVGRRSIFAKPSRASQPPPGGQGARVARAPHAPLATTRLTPTRFTLKVATGRQVQPQDLAPAVAGRRAAPQRQDQRARRSERAQRRHGGGGGGGSGSSRRPTTATTTARRTLGHDSDQDLLTDALERSLKTDPCNADTDGDGAEDGFEYRSALDLNHYPRTPAATLPRQAALPEPARPDRRRTPTTTATR